MNAICKYNSNKLRERIIQPIPLFSVASKLIPDKSSATRIRTSFLYTALSSLLNKVVGRSNLKDEDLSLIKDFISVCNSNNSLFISNYTITMYISCKKWAFSDILIKVILARNYNARPRDSVKRQS